MARGTIRKHMRQSGVSYEVRIPLGIDPVTGKQREWNKSFPTRKEAEAARIARLNELAQGTAVDPSRQTVAELMLYWLDTYARHNVSAKTLESYELTIRKHILPALGAVRVQKLTADQVQRFYHDKLAAGYGRRTVEMCHLRLYQALKQAVRLGLVARNVAELATPPRNVPMEMQTWTVEQARQFLQAAQGSSYGPIWMLYLATGLRRGELLGLRWRDIDQERRLMHVAQSVISLGGKPTIKAPKSKAGRRIVALQPEVMVALQEHRCRQEERRQTLGAAWEEHDLVFASANGTPIHPDNLRREFNRWIKVAGVPPIRIHDLRHTHVTLALAAGANLKAVSQRVGHARPSITMNVYAHVLPEQHAEVADQVGKLLFGTTTSEPGPGTP